MHQQREQWEPDRKALDAKIENTISNANCNAGNTKRIPATVNDGHHQPSDELACALQWWRNDGIDYVVDDDDDNELAAGNTTNPIENGASIRASQRNFMRNKEQRKFPIDNNTDDTHKLFAKSNDRAAGAAAAAVADNSQHNNDANRYECRALSPMVMPPTMIQCESVIHLETYYNHIVRIKRIELMSFENFMFLFIFTSFLFSNFFARFQT